MRRSTSMASAGPVATCTKLGPGAPPNLEDMTRPCAAAAREPDHRWPPITVCWSQDVSGGAAPEHERVERTESRRHASHLRAIRAAKTGEQKIPPDESGEEGLVCATLARPRIKRAHQMISFGASTNRAASLLPEATSRLAVRTMPTRTSRWCDPRGEPAGRGDGEIAATASDTLSSDSSVATVVSRRVLSRRALSRQVVGSVGRCRDGWCRDGRRRAGAVASGAPTPGGWRGLGPGRRISGLGRGGRCRARVGEAVGVVWPGGVEAGGVCAI